MKFAAVVRHLADSLAHWAIRPASAHCDTNDGPAVTDGRRALDCGNVNIALKWVRPEDENEVRTAFERARRVRTAGGEAAVLADQWFLENLVRIHRAGEGAAYDGIKPAGTVIPAQVRAADEALERGTIVVARPGDRHVYVDQWPGGRIRLLDKPPFAGQRPSISLMLATFAKTAADQTIGVLLTKYNPKTAGHGYHYESYYAYGGPARLPGKSR